ncbi:400_t:CDS:2 [Diversispora eburnea]|uniref:400_t:CDS:1 n=1 Tax=Diversispora eburnea TaxID=1213867 RepID=A0A9N9AE10_9GLOM|nr:400_t:CDS:2 [Diversispora eburnea]
MSGLAANKAGLQGINKEKGTPFFENEARKDEALSYKIEEMLKKYSTLLNKDLSMDLIRIDNMMEILESERDLSRIIVHIDMDAFYASVEERDNPSLKGKPMAVGDNSMLSTANYEARKYGVRSAMPGFIARKLCSHLILVPLHFDKYRAVSKSVREIFARYDPNFTPMTDEVVQQIREEIFKETQLTAKIILEFMKKLSIRKVSDIKTMGDLFQQRVYVYKMFTLSSFQFLMRASFGIGSTVVKT